LLYHIAWVPGNKTINLVVGPDNVKQFAENASFFLISSANFYSQGTPPDYVTKNAAVFEMQAHGASLEKVAEKVLEANLSAWKEPGWWFGTSSAIAGGLLKLAPVTSSGIGRTSPRSLSGVTEAEIDAAVSAPGRSNVMVQAPVENLRPLKTKPYGEGGQLYEYSFDAKSSVPGATKNVKTTLKVHDADPTAPLGSNSRSGTTLSIEQAKGNRKVVPDTSSAWGGRWVEKAIATAKEWAKAHIPI
jgi:hypothetical protein